MSREVPEWIGKTPDTKIPARVQARVFERHGGRCHITGRKILASDTWETDHVLAIINGGENRESNLAPALTSPHRKKTDADLKIKSKTARVRNKFLGIKQTVRNPIPGSKQSKYKVKIGGGVVLREGSK